MRKIAYLYTGMNVGGAQIVMLDLIKGCNNNFTPIIATDEGVLFDKNKNNYRSYRIPFKSKKIKSILKSIYVLNEIVKKENVSIIHSHHRYTTFIALIVSKITKVKVIHTEHNVFLNKNKINLRGKNIIAVSEKVKQNMIKNGIDNITVIYNGIDIVENNNERNNSCKNICFIGRLSKQKGILEFLDTFKGLLKNNSQLILNIVGDGELKPQIEKKITSLDINKNVKMHGYRENVIEVIREMDLFVMPSFYEGLPITMLEIMSQRKILIANDVGGISEVIKDKQNGYLCKLDDHTEMKNKIEYVIKNFENLEHIENNAYQTIKDKFTKDKMIQNHAKYYNNIYEK